MCFSGAFTMIEYTVQPIGNDMYSVHKCDGGDVPIVTYTVRAGNGKLKCDCPAGKWHSYCKHTNFVRDYGRRERQSEPIEKLMKISYKGELQ
jgi:hypothetical protein